MSLPGLESSEVDHVGRSYQAAIDFLMSRINYESRPDLAASLADFPLARMQRLLELLEQPQLAQPVIHVAGSKGKGSTATMIARILEQAGYRVGLFTSPHAHRYEERMTVNGVPASQLEIVSIVDRLRVVCDQMDHEITRGPSFFELTTAAGWLHFQAQQVDIAVIEVGLGGRLDSTNVCVPAVAVISSISKDHTRLLGDTLEKIAGEKAGIIKEGVPVISGVREAGPAGVIQKVAADHHSKLLQLGDEILITGAHQPDEALSPWVFDLQVGEERWQSLCSGMLGEHQTRNAAIAAAAVRQLNPEQFKVSADQIRDGLRAAILPMRVQVISRDPLVILDAAHNPASIQALCETLRSVPCEKKICLFSASKDKDVRELISILSREFDHFILTAFRSNPRAVPVDQLALIASDVEGCHFEIAQDPAECVEMGLKQVTQADLLCITGSFFFATEAEQFLQHVRA